MRSATPESIGEHNQKLILSYIRKNGPVSRADVSRGVEMSFPSVSANIRNLLDDDYISEIGTGDNAMGRKSTLLAFNASRGYVLGVDIGRRQIRMLLGDLIGDTVLTVKSDEETGSIPERLRKALKSVLRRSKIAKEKILCVGLGAPGIIDPVTKKVFLAPFIESFSEDDIRGVFGELLGADVPVFIENNMSCGVIGEKWKGAGAGFRDIVYVNYGVGIGSAIVMNDVLVRGSGGAAGETGFTVAGPGALRDSFEEEGVTEKAVSGHAIAGRMGLDDVKTAVETLIEGYERRDDAAAGFMKEIIDTVGIMLINTACVTNPEIIIISGGVGLALFDIAADSWRSMLAAHVPYPPEIVGSKLYNKANVLGAVKLCLRHLNGYTGAQFGF